MALGLYIHVPFCSSRCDYCAFATWDDRFEFVDQYLEYVIREIRLRSRGMRFHTVFFGGGTPTILRIDALAAIMDSIELVPDAEVSIEANPESLSSDVRAYEQVGINRVSLGVQSLRQNELGLLGRRHQVHDATRAIASLANSNLRYSCDFIFGVRGGSPDLLLEDVAGLLKIQRPPEHLSIYGLTVEAGTPLALQQERHPDDDDDYLTYLKIDASLKELGFEAYEISNFCSGNSYSRHNWNYWMQGEYLGVGPSAHSYLNGQRSWNIRDSFRWGRAVETGASSIAGFEELSVADKIFEGLTLALRTRIGVPLNVLNVDELPDDLYDLTLDHRIVLSAKGRLLESQLAHRLIVQNITADELMEHQSILPFDVGAPVK